MIIYIPDPWEALNQSQNEPLPRIRIKLSSGGHINAECLEVDQVRVLSLDSTDPMDYMNQQYQPGSIIQLKPSI
ncbi:MAG TPA: hypothetical protein GXX58_04205 [Gelria sp.]|nr:hypothetical protein [Gelria sp.]